ncbi:MAG: hypothetical protein IPL93_10215 [Actinomycetales bacterium]|nr:hypothetical protein [Actinomycetales bacterium]
MSQPGPARGGCLAQFRIGGRRAGSTHFVPQRGQLARRHTPVFVAIADHCPCRGDQSAPRASSDSLDSEGTQARNRVTAAYAVKINVN